MSEIDPGVVAVEAADQISAPDGTKEIGRRRLRKEDAKLVTGQTQWTDNIQFAGMLHLAILRDDGGGRGTLLIPGRAAQLAVLRAAGDDAFKNPVHGKSLEGEEPWGRVTASRGRASSGQAKVVCVTVWDMRRQSRLIAVVSTSGAAGATACGGESGLRPDSLPQDGVRPLRLRR